LDDNEDNEAQKSHNAQANDDLDLAIAPVEHPLEGLRVLLEFPGKV
jgi:hypothetical protein